MLSSSRKKASEDIVDNSFTGVRVGSVHRTYLSLLAHTLT